MLGIGTLLSNLYEHGYAIYGQDFSKKMIEIAQKKMPKDKLYNRDISKGLVKPLSDNKYDAIIATYSLHHLNDSEKVIFLKTLLTQLYEGGAIYIDDVAFETCYEHDKCTKQVGNAWDKDEF